MVCTVDEMIEKLNVKSETELRYSAQSFSGGRGVVDASQMLAQAVVAASRFQTDKTVRSIHMLFAKMATEDKLITIELEPVHLGRSFSYLSVSASQEGQVCAKGLMQMDTDQEDFIRHSLPMPDVAGPEQSHPLQMPVQGREMRVVEKVDLMDPEDVGPAEFNVWIKYEKVANEACINQGLIAHLSNHFLIATAMCPHRGVSLGMAHKTLSAGILSLNVVFHEAPAAEGWLLYSHKSPHASRGLSYGTGEVFTQAGQHIASFTQGNMIRGLAKKLDQTEKKGPVL